mgnify:CR=1 FL=1
MLRIADYPGLLVWRTVAMLINEALDAVQKGVASPQDVDTAMRLASTIRMARWHGENALAGGGCCNCWRTCNTIMARSAIAPVPCCARRR